MAEDETFHHSGHIPGLSSDDVVPNVYEGGLKTWECSLDLAAFVASQAEEIPADCDENITVIEVSVIYIFSL